MFFSCSFNKKCGIVDIKIVIEKNILLAKKSNFEKNEVLIIVSQ